MRLDSRVKYFIKNISVLNSIVSLPLTNKALEIALKEMNAEKGFKRHNGDDYFVHMIAIAQTALDFGLVAQRIKEGSEKEADILLATCLLHDLLEDVEWVSLDYLFKEFGPEVTKNVDNLTKREGEDIEQYLERVGSNSISALVKILDRQNNVSTLSESKLTHREKQLKETREYYLPLTKLYRKKYWVDSAFYWQARTTMVALLDLLELTIKYEKQAESLKTRLMEGKTSNIKDAEYCEYSF